MTPIQVGDEVHVTEHGRSQRGVVMAVGRKLVTIEVNRREKKFLLDTQRLNGPQVGSGCHFLTLEQAAERERRHAPLEILRQHGISLSERHSLTLKQIEALAEVAKTFTEQEG